MNDYYEVNFSIAPASVDASDLLADALCDVGFETFEPTDEGDSLKAFVPASLFDIPAINSAIEALPLPVNVTFTHSFVEGRDWNAEWEKNYFRPILIGDRVAVHSSFHTDVPKAEYDIVIDPKMAFGTGHHATTTLMIRSILELPLEGRSVIDMGTGTGILAILCAMRGAGKVLAVEIDEFAYVNARENFVLNGVDSTVSAVLGDASALDSVPEASADVLLANINRNIILGDIAAYARTLRPGGMMLLSGFFTEDIPVLEEAASEVGLKLEGSSSEERWASMRLSKI